MPLSEISNRIALAEQAAARAAGSARLIAVSKLQPNARVTDVLDQGHRLFGENRVQEAAGKWPAWREQYGDVCLHLLGPLQTNKTRQAFDLFDAIHALDRPKLAKVIARLAQETGHCPQLFIQVNTGSEVQKAGVLPADADGFIADCRAMDLTISGLMCIPPASTDATKHFNMLADIARRNDLPELSMGMSADFETAVACGATYVRVGSAIFGARA
ncbi:MAG: YggS family pyridoxal phosphate-dependent enzyme [Paracoccaceae bacterium]